MIPIPLPYGLVPQHLPQAAPPPRLTRAVALCDRCGESSAETRIVSDQAHAAHPLAQTSGWSELSFVEPSAPAQQTSQLCEPCTRLYVAFMKGAAIPAFSDEVRYELTPLCSMTLGARDSDYIDAEMPRTIRFVGFHFDEASREHLAVSGFRVGPSWVRLYRVAGCEQVAARELSAPGLGPAPSPFVHPLTISAGTTVRIELLNESDAKLVASVGIVHLATRAARLRRESEV